LLERSRAGRCGTLRRQSAARGKRRDGYRRMAVRNDRKPCEMRVGLGGNPATSLTVRARPGNGTLTVESSSVSYTPNPGFTGKDAFDVQWFGIGFGPNSRSRNLRTKVAVTVRATDDKPAM
jgi:hypothetical protein